VVTLWWAVLLGWLMLASRPVLFRRLLGRDGGGAVEGDAEAEG
jgi:hypothetical protein